MNVQKYRLGRITLLIMMMIIISTYWTWKRTNPHAGGDNRMTKIIITREENRYWARNKNYNNNNNKEIWVWIRIKIE